jgi:hypothetical protein
MNRCPACLQPYCECECNRWCLTCGCRTNHTAEFHRQMEVFMPKEPTR